MTKSMVEDCTVENICRSAFCARVRKELAMAAIHFEIISDNFTKEERWGASRRWQEKADEINAVLEKNNE